MDADPVSLELIGSADLICYPVGSFFSSVLANLLPRGVGGRVVARHCPKIYVPNPGRDLEMSGYSLSGAVERLLEFVRRDSVHFLSIGPLRMASMVPSAASTSVVGIGRRSMSRRSPTSPAPAPSAAPEPR